MRESDLAARKGQKRANFSGLKSRQRKTTNLLTMLEKLKIFDLFTLNFPGVVFLLSEKNTNVPTGKIG